MGRNFGNFQKIIDSSLFPINDSCIITLHGVLDTLPIHICYELSPLHVTMSYWCYFCIGQFLKQSTEVNGRKMQIGDRKLSVKPYERLNGLMGNYQKCWSTDDYGMKFLDGTAEDYLVKDLFDSDFTYSHYHCN